MRDHPSQASSLHGQASSMRQCASSAWVVYNHWTGMVEWNGGMEWWNGMVEWNSGMCTAAAVFSSIK